MWRFLLCCSILWTGGVYDGKSGNDGKIVLEIERELNLKKDEIIESEETDTTVDYWIIREDIHVDI